MIAKNKQKEFLIYIKLGLTDVEIATEMQVSRKTVYNWKKKIRDQIEQNEEIALGMILIAFNDLIANNKIFRDKASDPEGVSIYELKKMGRTTFENSQTIANIVKSLGVGKCKGLLNEIEGLKKDLDDAKNIIQLLLLNNIDLKQGLKEPNPNADELAKIICS